LYRDQWPRLELFTTEKLRRDAIKIPTLAKPARMGHPAIGSRGYAVLKMFKIDQTSFNFATTMVDRSLFSSFLGQPLGG